jgi:hypothetical protein
MEPTMLASILANVFGNQSAGDNASQGQQPSSLIRKLLSFGRQREQQNNNQTAQTVQPAQQQQAPSPQNAFSPIVNALMKFGGR